MSEAGNNRDEHKAATTVREAGELERDLIEELRKAAATFSDLRVALELLRHEQMAMACGIAEEHIRVIIDEANRERYTR